MKINQIILVLEWVEEQELEKQILSNLLKTPDVLSIESHTFFIFRILGVVHLWGSSFL